MECKKGFLAHLHPTICFVGYIVFERRRFLPHVALSKLPTTPAKANACWIFADDLPVQIDILGGRAFQGIKRGQNMKTEVWIHLIEAVIFTVAPGACLPGRLYLSLVIPSLLATKQRLLSDICLPP